MSRNVTKLSKRPSYHIQSNYSNHSSPQQQFPNHLSLDLSKGNDIITLPKETNTLTTPSQTNFKKLGLLLNPHRDKSLAAQVMSGNSVHVSPKNFLETSKKLNKAKTPTNGNKSTDFNLISPKDLVRKAMSKMKSKENVKQELQRNSSASKKNFPKSMTLSLNSGYVPSEKRNESFKVRTTTLEDNLFLNSSPKNEKAEKMMKLKKIYKDDLSRFMRVNTNSPSEDQVTFNKGSLTTSQSQTGLGLTLSGSLGTTKPSRAPSTTFSNPGDGEKRKNSKPKPEKMEKSHKKVGSFGQIDLLNPKECKSSMRQRTKSQGNKFFDMKKSIYIGNPQRVTPVSLTQSTYCVPDRPNSPVINNLEGVNITTVEEAPFDTEEMITDEGTLSVTNRDEKKIPSAVLDGKKTEPQDKLIQLEAIDLAVEDHVKFAQSTLLEKLRDTLGSKEFVKREEYERVLKERIEFEQVAYSLKDENMKLRGFFNHLQTTGLLTDNYQELKDIIIKQQQELQVLRKREDAVKRVFHMIKKTGVALEEWTTTEENESLYTEQDFYLESGKEKAKPIVNVYAMNGKNKDKYPVINNYTGIVNTEASIQDSQYSKEVMEPVHSEEIEEIMLEVKSGSENKVSDDDNNSIFSSQMKKNIAEAKSTADSSPLFSANGMSAHSIMKAKLNGKFNLDLTKVGGKVLVMKSNEISSQSSGEKLINQYIITNGGN